MRPNIDTLVGLRRLIKSYSSPLAFSVAELNYRDADRARILLAVVEYLIRAQKGLGGKTERSRLRQWAKSVQPEDWKVSRIRGFALSGFQYLRMLLGAQTVKPDVHIRRYVGGIVRHSVSDVEALALLEISAKRIKLPLRSLDYALWSASARKKRDG